MPILVSDASILADLEHGALLEGLFLLPYGFTVPDLLFERELHGPLGARLTGLGLRVEELSPAELVRATEIRRLRRELSATDTFAFAVAEARRWPLLSSNERFHHVAGTTGVECYGLLWICDYLEHGKLIPLRRLHEGLAAIARRPRCRLLSKEVQTRLERYVSRPSP